MVREIKALQAKIDTIQNEDELRAMEEDITGKILWVCWCGVSSEVNEILPKVGNYILEENAWQGLYEIARIMKGTPLIDPDDDQAHLRRIVADAGAGISKYRLLLAAPAEDQSENPGMMIKGFMKGTLHPVPDGEHVHIPRISLVDGVGTSKPRDLSDIQAAGHQKAGDVLPRHEPMRTRITVVDSVGTSKQEGLLTALATEHQAVRVNPPIYISMSGSALQQAGAIRSRPYK
ncbi:hypothetical protein EDD16DRAFT_1682424 [Pisolithus croceorrhizus]|nr:hypothetical protein EDD16DRAFT_1682424 [Pisolithus croceorrhizus]KAI6165382.1 hypothetical protein EDD17DRAFT_224920 [Pisolithus thermaeus]